MKQLAKDLLMQQAQDIEQKMIRCVELDQLDLLNQYRQLFDNIMNDIKALD